MVERDLPVIPRHDVQPEHSQAHDERDGQLEQLEALQHPERGEGKTDAGGHGGKAECGVHTRLHTTRPNSPEGRTTRTPMMMISATVSFSSVPTT